MANFKKKVTLPSEQLSLFDLFSQQPSNNKQNENRNNQSSDDSHKRQPVHDQSLSASEGQSAAAGDSGTVLRPAKDDAPGQTGELKSGWKAGGIPEQQSRTISQTNGNTSDEPGGEREVYSNSFDSKPSDQRNTGSGKLRANYRSDYNPQNNITLKTFSKSKAYADNITALQTLLDIQLSKTNPTQEQQQAIAAYRGFGGLKEILLDVEKDVLWEGIPEITRNRVRSIHTIIQSIADNGVGDAEKWLQSIQRSTLSAHYTPESIIQGIYSIIEKTGFQGGKILDPASGTGRFMTLMPENIATNSTITALEIDSMTGQLLKKLLPVAQVNIQGFERSVLPVNEYDLILTNVPFAAVPIFDPQLQKQSDKRFEKAASNLHNFFIAKSIMLARPGSLLAFVTSRFTLDSSENREIRELMGDYCAPVTALRLPDNAFTAEAGTEVVADIIILRKRDQPILGNLDNPLLQVQEYTFKDENNVEGQVTINSYFLANPDHVLGKHSFNSGMFRDNNYTVTATSEDLDVLRQQIEVIGGSDIAEPFYSKQQAQALTQAAPSEDRKTIIPGQFETIGNLVQFKDGYVGRIAAEEYSGVDDLGNPVTYRMVDPVTVRKDDVKKISLFITIRNDLKSLIYHELNGYNDDVVEPIRKRLNSNYFRFVKQFGNFLAPVNAKLLQLDIADQYLVASLQRLDTETKQVLPSDILFKRTIAPPSKVDSVETLKDAISLSLSEYGSLRMEYIAQLLNTDVEEIMKEQNNDNALIFLTPEGYYQTRDEYLSGNIIEKLEVAQDLAKEDPRFKLHVKLLTASIPQKIAATDIYSPIHARWIPQKHIEDFLAHVTMSSTGQIGIKYSKSADHWDIEFFPNSEDAEIFKTVRRKASWVFEHVLNGVEPVVQYLDADKKTVIDSQDTLLAKENFKKIQQLWDDFKFTDIDRRQDMENIYNYRYNNTVVRNFEGAGKDSNYPGLVGFVPVEHQKDAVFRTVQTQTGVMDHIVGAGKTLCQIITAMELRRLKIANKPMILGMNAQIPQLYLDFKKAYPFAKILYPQEKDFEKVNRKKLLSSIATNDWDCILITHEQFTKIRQSRESQERAINEMLQTIDAEIYESDDRQEIKRLQARRYSYEQKLEKLATVSKDNDILDFTQLGVDFLLVDESHEFKNLEFTTRLRNVTGLGNPEGSKKAFNLLMACRHIQNLRGADKGVVFYSGTPLSNSVSELYLIHKYLTPSKLDKMGLDTFDKWASLFASIYSDLEFYLGRYKIVNRIREFKNLPELIVMYREIADVKNDSNLKLDKPKAIHNLVKIAPSEQQLQYIEKLYHFVQSKGRDYRHELGLTNGYDPKMGKNNSANLLAINMAKKLSLDPRLISMHNGAGEKLGLAADNIKKIYVETNEFRGTQLIFCDLSTPKSNNTLDNLHDLFEGDIPQELGIRNLSEGEFKDVFGESYYDSTTKPRLQQVKNKLIEILSISEEEYNLAVQIANSNSGGFNAYDTIKKELMLRGIPADQIVFIHDYKTRAKKAELYKAMNDGQVRITLGSTSKLGTGTNVQYRLCGMHHIDISWKPSLIVQRNGRGERQGNWAAKNKLGNVIPAFYYATERTFDSYMYNLNAVKAKFIEQMKLSNVSVREMKDINEEMDLSTMGAELSGNPLVKEKANLERRINELSSLKKSFNIQQYDAQEKLRRSTKALDFTINAIPKYDRLIEFCKTLQIDPETQKPITPFVVDNIEYLKPGEAGTALFANQEKTRKTIELRQKHSSIDELSNDLNKFRPMGTIAGYIILMNVISLGSSFYLQDPDTSERIGSIKQTSSSEVGTALQIRNTLLSGEQIKEDVLLSKAEQEQNIKNAQSMLGKVFEHDAELQTAKERLTEIDRIIHAEIQAASAAVSAKKEDEQDNNQCMQVQESPEPYLKMR